MLQYCAAFEGQCIIDTKWKKLFGTTPTVPEYIKICDYQVLGIYLDTTFVF